MEDITKAPRGASQNSHCKDSEFAWDLRRIKKYFLDGSKGSVADILVETKVLYPKWMIDYLRNQGWKIMETDCNGFPFYWLDHEQRMLKLTELYPD